MDDNRKWRKATYSGSQGGSCVEIGQDGPSVLVRDTKLSKSPELRFSRAAWCELTDGLKKDQ